MSEALVLKPRPGSGWEFGGGEDGAWRRAHAGEPTPWWLLERQPVIATGSMEEAGSQWWETPYFLGLRLTPLAWLAAVALALRLLIIRRGSGPAG